MRRVRALSGAFLLALALGVIALAIFVTGGRPVTWGLLILALILGGLGTYSLATAGGSPPLRAGLRVASAAVIVIGIVLSFYGGASNTRKHISRHTRNIPETRKELAAYFEFYNTRRRHQGLGNRTPDDVYWSTLRDEEQAA